jgi:hypothetical protein
VAVVAMMAASSSQLAGSNGDALQYKSVRIKCCEIKRSKFKFSELWPWLHTIAASSSQPTPAAMHRGTQHPTIST